MILIHENENKLEQIEIGKLSISISSPLTDISLKMSNNFNFIECAFTEIKCCISHHSSPPTLILFYFISFHFYVYFPLDLDKLMIRIMLYIICTHKYTQKKHFPCISSIKFCLLPHVLNPPLTHITPQIEMMIYF